MSVAPSPTRPWLPYTAAITAGLLVIAGAFLFVRQRDTQSSEPPLRTHCAVRLEVLSSTEKDVLIRELADRYNRSDRNLDGGGCAQVNVKSLNSGEAADWLAGVQRSGQSQAGNPSRPHVWLPTSSLWIGVLQLLDKEAGRSPLVPPQQYYPIANSPLVIAMPRERAEVISAKGLGWGEILGVSGKEGWTSFGEPSWGPFTYLKDNPTDSTSGMAATIVSYYAATGSDTLTTADLKNPRVIEFVRRIEANVLYYENDSVELLRKLAGSGRPGGRPSGDDLRLVDKLNAIIMQEELVYQYNTGWLDPTGEGRRPEVPLVAVRPKGRTFNMDHPYVPLANASEEQRLAADDFYRFLTEGAQQQRFVEFGFRDYRHQPSKQLLDNVGGGPAGSPPNHFELPRPEDIKAIRDSWSTLRKKAKIILAVDTSGSMEVKIGARTRLEVAAEAVANGVTLLNREDQIGLWSFSSEGPDRPQAYREEIPLGTFDRKRIEQGMAGLKAAGDTALYVTVRQAHRSLTDGYELDRIHAVVVLSDGRNDHADDDLNRLIADVQLNPNRPVKIFCIAFGPQAPFATLDQIARAAGGRAFDATDPANLDKAFVELVSNF